jgi:nickel-dependent lactate racemase
MRIGIYYGRERLDLEVPDGRLAGVRRREPALPLPDPAAAVRAALETPHGFPALRRALTPDDHVAVVIDEHLPHFVDLLTAVLEHVTGAGVAPAAITLVCPSSSPGQPWLEALPETFEDMHLEVHDPTDRRRLSYLATTKHGRRIYLNRTVVDADQVVVLAGRGYDPLLVHGGAEAALYPVLSNEATLQETGSRLSLDAPGDGPSPLGKEAAEVAWLLGAPFLVHIIEGAGDDVAHVVAGLADTSAEAQRLLYARWRVAVERPAETVVASVSGDPGRHNFADLARALGCAARVVQPGGRIVLLSRAAPALGPGAAILRQADDPGLAIEALRRLRPPDLAAAFLWARAVQQTHVYLLSGLDPEAAEELFTTPLDNAGQVQRLLGTEGSCLFLEDAHKIVAVTEGSP